MNGQVSLGPARSLFISPTRMTAEDISFVDHLDIRKLDGAPPYGFDCGREDQNHFLYEHAWNDQQQQLSITYLYFVDGVFAAYATVCMDALPLGRRERGLFIQIGRAQV